jgi:FKBP-type peptidyl-prolyl cis-trans isomerase FklB
MKLKSLPLTTLALLGLFGSSAFAADAPSAPLTSEKDKISYSIGLDIGKNFTKQGIDLDTQVFLSGLEDGRQNKPGRMSEQEIRETLTALQNKLVKQQQDGMKKLAESNSLEGNAFLEKNKSAPGVKTLSSGLQYRVLTEGKGTPPGLKDTVKTHYRGTLINGTEFDSSYARGQPIDIPVEGVIKGWTEALQLMKPGSKWQIFVPASLAYGEQGAGNVIGPNATLIFDIELLSVTKAAPQVNAGGKKGKGKH